MPRGRAHNLTRQPLVETTIKVIYSSQNGGPASELSDLIQQSSESS
jgi:hypothetical protein